jgi:hypothetical protein
LDHATTSDQSTVTSGPLVPHQTPVSLRTASSQRPNGAPSISFEIRIRADDRLPAAIRGSRAPARIVEVTRAANSAISVVESTRPATRLLDDAFAIAVDDAVPEDIKRSAIPALCREALEAAAWDVYSSKALADGQSREDTEGAWEDAAKTAKRLALALAGNADDVLVVDKWRAGGRARKDTLSVVNKGVHQGVSDYKGAVNDARLAVGDLARGAA